ncbi:N-acetyltransferase [Tumebacillus permanentifrigoris]|uniref:Acetyltransferase (GNAT) family protein n=1 Tax=Tumebacillus permanentifrigoris TaxID=378543 RepID=A0A316D5W5_9BACL|nr:N-acetyltransferase [Tumebacillus permanentifrigoris]PWK06958.1 acetyltransferase (GNAT) family protein [Tumebacillus permanentifrigoris]
MPHVQSLQINYQTLEEFKKFRENGLEELSMSEDLRSNLVEDNSVSPFFGIYEDGKLVARISLYKIDAKYNQYTETETDYHELMKLEVLPGYKGKGYGTALVEYAQSLGLPVKTNVRLGAQEFFLKLGFQPVKYDPVRDRGENPYVWLPEQQR